LQFDNLNFNNEEIIESTKNFIFNELESGNVVFSESKFQNFAIQNNWNSRDNALFLEVEQCEANLVQSINSKSYFIIA